MYDGSWLMQTQLIFEASIGAQDEYRYSTASPGAPLSPSLFAGIKPRPTPPLLGRKQRIRFGGQRRGRRRRWRRPSHRRGRRKGCRPPAGALPPREGEVRVAGGQVRVWGGEGRGGERFASRFALEGLRKKNACACTKCNRGRQWYLDGCQAFEKFASHSWDIVSLAYDSQAERTRRARACCGGLRRPSPRSKRRSRQSNVDVDRHVLGRERVGVGSSKYDCRVIGSRTPPASTRLTAVELDFSEGVGC